MLLLMLTFLSWAKPLLLLLSTRMSIILLAASVGLLLRGKYLSRQLAHNWTEDYAWHVHKQQVGMVSIWVAMAWLYLLVEVLK